MLIMPSSPHPAPTNEWREEEEERTETMEVLPGWHREDKRVAAAAIFICHVAAAAQKCSTAQIASSAPLRTNDMIAWRHPPSPRVPGNVPGAAMTSK